MVSYIKNPPGTWLFLLLLSPLSFTLLPISIPNLYLYLIYISISISISIAISISISIWHIFISRPEIFSFLLLSLFPSAHKHLHLDIPLTCSLKHWTWIPLLVPQIWYSYFSFPDSSHWSVGLFSFILKWITRYCRIFFLFFPSSISLPFLSSVLKPRIGSALWQ